MMFKRDSRIWYFHHLRRVFNVGDFLASPAHYFRMAPGDRDALIIGGGAFRDLGLAQAERAGLGPDGTVLWGVGLTIPPGSDDPGAVAKLPHALWSLRDIDRVTDTTRFIPCVSCMHTMLDRPADGTETLLFLNAGKEVTDFGHPALAGLKSSEYRVLRNHCSPAEFSSALRTSRAVVTNSYHGAYWALLAGREVACFGYSSKFTSLFRTLGLDAGLIRDYPRGDAPALARSIQGLTKERFVRLRDPLGTRTRFRELNMGFARKIRDLGLATDVAVDQSRIEANLRKYQWRLRLPRWVKYQLLPRGLAY